MKRKLFNKREDTLIKTLIVVTLLSGVFLGQVKVARVKAEMIDPSGNIPSMNIYTAPIKETLPPTVIEEIRWAFADKGEIVVQQALMVARCESGLKPQAVNSKNKNGSVDRCAFQINSIHGVPARFLKNNKICAAVARQLYDEAKGWGHWYSSRKCHGLK